MSKFLISGVREIDFLLENEAIFKIKSLWQEYASNISDFPHKRFEGKGIVMCAGGVSYFTCAWIAINNLRSVGCRLPVELWFLKGELSGEVVGKLEELGVKCRDFLSATETFLSGVSLKPLAIILSRFKEVLFLDADNNCLKDPSYLFNNIEYLSKGTIFWPDYWKTAPDNPIWEITESTCYDTYEQESGQILLNKEKCWKALNLSLFFNERAGIFHKLLFGDKDTFKFAWLALNTEFHMIETEVGSCGFETLDKNFMGTTMVQHDLAGDVVFLHKNLIKWNKTAANNLTWKKIKRFKGNDSMRKYLFNYNHYGKHFFIDLRGDVECEDTPPFVVDLENKSLDFLRKLRVSSFYQRFLKTHGKM